MKTVWLYMYIVLHSTLQQLCTKNFVCLSAVSECTVFSFVCLFFCCFRVYCLFFCSLHFTTCTPHNVYWPADSYAFWVVCDSGFVVMVFVLIAKGPGFKSQPSHTKYLKISIVLVATLSFHMPGIMGLVGLDVSILWQGKITNLICNFYLR